MHRRNERAWRLWLAIPVVLLACLLAACGSSGTSGSSSASQTSSTSTTTTGGPGAQGASRFSALRECLKKQGINLPAFKGGTRPNSSSKGRPPTGGFFNGGGRAGGFAGKLPKGVSRAKYEAAIKKCGGGFPGAGGKRLGSANFKKSLQKFAACMRENGVQVGEPNTSGGPIFNTKGIDTSSAKFKAAESKCRSDLRGGFQGAPGAGGVPPGGAQQGAPPTGEGG